MDNFITEFKTYTGNGEWLSLKMTQWKWLQKNKKWLIKGTSGLLFQTKTKNDLNINIPINILK